MSSSFLRHLLCRRSLYRVNSKLHRLSLHGLGILNYENDAETGQHIFLKRFAQATRYLESPITIVDVGANVGAFSIKVRQLMPLAQIYALEPHPKTFICLKKQSEQWRFEALNYGCGESRTSTNMYDRADQRTSEHASLYRAVIEEIHCDFSLSVEVQLISLDEFRASNHLTTIHLLKIDTEGHEYAVLQGAKETIKANRIEIVQFEFNEMNVISRTFFRDFVGLLPAFEFYRMLPDGLIPIDRNPLSSELFGFQNIIARRRGLAGQYSCL